MKWPNVQNFHVLSPHSRPLAENLTERSLTRHCRCKYTFRWRALKLGTGNCWPCFLRALWWMLKEPETSFSGGSWTARRPRASFEESDLTWRVGGNVGDYEMGERNSAMADPLVRSSRKTERSKIRRILVDNPPCASARDNASHRDATNLSLSLSLSVSLARELPVGHRDETNWNAQVDDARFLIRKGENEGGTREERRYFHRFFDRGA